MRNVFHFVPIRYGVAVLAVGIVVAIKKLLDPLAGQDSPFLLFVISVMVSSWLGGSGQDFWLVF
jgi:hypothetical protein